MISTNTWANGFSSNVHLQFASTHPISPKVARVVQRKKSPTNSDFKICYGDTKLIQNCKKQKKSRSHFGDSS